MACGGRAGLTPLGQASRDARPQTERGDAPTSPLPNAGLAKLVPVTASYDTWGSTPCLPLLPLIWQLQMSGTGRQAGFLRVSAIRRSSPTVNRPETLMPVPTGNPQDTQTAIVVLIAIGACLCVAYWRVALRVILVLLLALTIYGVVAGIEGATSLMAVHHR